MKLSEFIIIITWFIALCKGGCDFQSTLNVTSKIDCKFTAIELISKPEEISWLEEGIKFLGGLVIETWVPSPLTRLLDQSLLLFADEFGNPESQTSDYELLTKLNTEIERIYDCIPEQIKAYDVAKDVNEVVSGGIFDEMRLCNFFTSWSSRRSCLNNAWVHLSKTVSSHFGKGELSALDYERKLPLYNALTSGLSFYSAVYLEEIYIALKKDHTGDECNDVYDHADMFESIMDTFDNWIEKAYISLSAYYKPKSQSRSGNCINAKDLLWIDGRQDNGDIITSGREQVKEQSRRFNNHVVSTDLSVSFSINTAIPKSQNVNCSRNVFNCEIIYQNSRAWQNGNDFAILVYPDISKCCNKLYNVINNEISIINNKYEEWRKNWRYSYIDSIFDKQEEIFDLYPMRSDDCSWIATARPTNAPTTPKPTLKPTPKPIPWINIRRTNDFADVVTQEMGSGADRDGSWWKPKIYEGESFLSFYTVQSYHRPTFNVYVITDAPNDVLREPIRYEKTWDDAGTWSTMDIYFYRPIPPPGYTCFGDFISRSGNINANGYKCVRNDYVESVSANVYFMWNDKGSGADNDGSIFKIDITQFPYRYDKSSSGYPNTIDGPFFILNHAKYHDQTTRQPTTKQPTTKQPTTKQPTTKQPTTKQPTTKQPTTKQPTTKQPTTITTNPTPAPSDPTPRPTPQPTKKPTAPTMGFKENIWCVRYPCDCYPSLCQFYY